MSPPLTMQAFSRLEEVFIVKVVEAAIDTSKTPEEAMAIAQSNLLHHRSCEKKDQAMTIIKKHFSEHYSHKVAGVIETSLDTSLAAPEKLSQAEETQRHEAKQTDKPVKGLKLVTLSPAQFRKVQKHLKCSAPQRAASNRSLKHTVATGQVRPPRQNKWVSSDPNFMAHEPLANAIERLAFCGDDKAGSS